MNFSWLSGGDERQMRDSGDGSSLAADTLRRGASAPIFINETQPARLL